MQLRAQRTALRQQPGGCLRRHRGEQSRLGLQQLPPGAASTVLGAGAAFEAKMLGLPPQRLA